MGAKTNPPNADCVHDSHANCNETNFKATTRDSEEKASFSVDFISNQQKQMQTEEASRRTRSPLAQRDSQGKA